MSDPTREIEVTREMIVAAVKISGREFYHGGNIAGLVTHIYRAMAAAAPMRHKPAGTVAGVPVSEARDYARSLAAKAEASRVAVDAVARPPFKFPDDEAVDQSSTNNPPWTKEKEAYLKRIGQVVQGHTRTAGSWNDLRKLASVAFPEDAS
jgi:hypothetical protein